MAAERVRRANAGKNIGKLIDRELGGDTFYTTAYGGFEEESGDEEYETEDSEDDVVDSDFDASEEGERGDSAEDEEEPQRKKKKWAKLIIAKTKATQKLQPSTTHIQPPKPKRSKHTSTPAALEASEPRTFRRSTHEVSEEFRKRRQEEERRRRRCGPRKQRLHRKLTQEEILAEARITEIENLACLEAFTRLEAEKKRVKEKKTVLQGPVIRFHSVSMPLITESSSSRIAANDAIEETEIAEVASSTGSKPQAREKYCRNFLIFTDTQSFPAAFFPSRKACKPKQKLFCPITGLPAKYIDPLTSTPYATPQAFKILRNRYVSEGEQKCEKRLLQLSSWLEEKKRKKLEART